MGVTRQLQQYATRKAARKLIRAVPFLGAVVALATLGRAIRQKGLFGGTVDTALDMTPYVGAAKNLAEAGRGRDFIRDRADGARAGALGPR